MYSYKFTKLKKKLLFKKVYHGHFSRHFFATYSQDFLSFISKFGCLCIYFLKLFAIIFKISYRSVISFNINLVKCDSKQKIPFSPAPFHFTLVDPDLDVYTGSSVNEMCLTLLSLTPHSLQGHQNLPGAH